MEDPIATAIDLTRAILLISETVGEERDRMTLNRLCCVITEKLQTIEDQRGQLFHLLHPNRAHFDEVGWPDKSKPEHAAA